MKKWHFPFLLLLISGVIFIKIRHDKTPHHTFQSTEGRVFGTIYHAKYQYSTDLLSDITRTLQKVDNSLSMFNKESCISKINAGTTDIPDSLFVEIFTLSQEISKITDGNFDPTVAPLVSAWGFGKGEKQATDSASIDSILEFVGWNKIELANNRIIKKDPRITLDFSAIAKGYGADCIAKMFEEKGIQNYMIEIGGEIVCKGNNPKGEPWKIGINKPIEESIPTQEIQNILTIRNCAMATSGNYRNYYMKDGKKIAHTINPKTGFPIQTEILSSTVLAPSCATADAYATSFMVMGLEKTKEIVDSNPEIEAYIIYANENGNHNVWCTETIKGLLK